MKTLILLALVVSVPALGAQMIEFSLPRGKLSVPILGCYNPAHHAKLDAPTKVVVQASGKFAVNCADAELMGEVTPVDYTDADGFSKALSRPGKSVGIGSIKKSKVGKGLKVALTYQTPAAGGETQTLFVTAGTGLAILIRYPFFLKLDTRGALFAETSGVPR